MRRLFSCLADLELFTHQLPLHQNELSCKNCRDRHCFMSHGFVYKKGHQGQNKKVGKRFKTV